MKVYIGKYPNNWWFTREWAEAIHARRHGKEWGFQVEEEEYDWVDRAVDRFADWWQDVLNATINPIMRRLRKRRISVRIDPSDTWSMDHTLALIIHPMLIQIRDTKHGSPYVDPEDVPEIGKGEEISFGHSDDLVHDRWDWVLNEMIWAFEQVLDDEDEGMKNYYVPYEEDEEVGRMGWKNEKTGEMTYMQTEEQARKMGRFDFDLYDAYNNRIKRGLTFFGKYYRGLWD